ncbi:MAG: EAL domain-containing protein [Azospirillum sp.]|nr:EAL domain-containing protein [Azospirillum sp.]
MTGGDLVLADDLDSDGFCVDSYLEAVSAKTRYVFQPIVNSFTGACYGFEALLRGQEALGFATIPALFDHAHDKGFLHRLDVLLREKALRGFVALGLTDQCRLFFNLDNRVLRSPDYRPHRTAALLRHLGLGPTAVCFELSELHAVSTVAEAEATLRLYRDQSFMLAIDDFGIGFSGLRLMYEHQPNLVKIDRFFVAGIDHDDRKRTFVAAVANLAHVLGIAVVAEGVETEAEFLMCKQIGCDLVQGFFVARPLEISTAVPAAFQTVIEANRRDRRQRRSDERLVRVELDSHPALEVGDAMAVVFDGFRRNKDRSFFPVIDERRQPLGVIREAALKEFIYSRYGKDLLHNKTLGRNLRHFLSDCPVCDINTAVEDILSIYTQTKDPVGVIIVENFRYAGMLSAESLLRVLNEKNLVMACNQNPLTKLPGNDAINDHVTAALEDGSVPRVFAYFDLDNFKPFNDQFGFRQGDRAILLFADLLRSHIIGPDCFIGHIGGDDFFASWRAREPEQVVAQIGGILDKFRHDAESFYDLYTRERGYVTGKDRDGNPKHFSLLACSAAVAVVPEGVWHLTADQLVGQAADMKHTAKRARDHLCVRYFGGDGNGAAARSQP